MEADWNKIRKEYLKGGTSYRKLSAKYGVPFGALRGRAKAENWVQLAAQSKHKTCTKMVETVSDQEARVETSVYDAAVFLLDVFKRSVVAADEAGIMTPDVVKEYGSALRQIQLVMDSKPTKLDIQEQEARIAKLRKEAMNDADDEDTGVILMPPVMEVSDGK